MSVIYYVAIEGERRGPLTHLQLRQLIDNGEVSAGNLAWHQELDGWKPLGELREFEMELHRAEGESHAQATAAAQQASTGGDNPPPNSLHSAAQSSGAGELSRVRHTEGEDPQAAATAAMASAEPVTQSFRLWTRIGARLVDTILLTSAACILFSLAGGALVAGLGMFFPLALIASTFLMEAGLLCSFGTTPGKALLGVIVRSASGAAEARSPREARGREELHRSV